MWLLIISNGYYIKLLINNNDCILIVNNVDENWNRNVNVNWNRNVDIKLLIVNC